MATLIPFPDVPIVSQDLPRLIFPGQTVIEHPFGSASFSGPSVVSRGIALWETTVEFLIATPEHAQKLSLFFSQLAGSQCTTDVPVNQPRERDSSGDGRLVSVPDVVSPDPYSIRLWVSPRGDLIMREGKMFSTISGRLYILNKIISSQPSTDSFLVQVQPNVSPDSLDVGTDIFFDSPYVYCSAVDVPPPISVGHVLHDTVAVRFRSVIA